MDRARGIRACRQIERPFRRWPPPEEHWSSVWPRPPQSPRRRVPPTKKSPRSSTCPPARPRGTWSASISNSTSARNPNSGDAVPNSTLPAPEVGQAILVSTGSGRCGDRSCCRGRRRAGQSAGCRSGVVMRSNPSTQAPRDRQVGTMGPANQRRRSGVEELPDDRGQHGGIHFMGLSFDRAAG
jgi:hypothetical protein